MFQQWNLMVFAMLSEAISARRDTKLRILKKAQLAMYRTRLSGNLRLGKHEHPHKLPPPDTVGRISYLGGLLNSYHRKAA